MELKLRNTKTNTGYRGVTFRKRISNPFDAQFTFKGSRITLGVHKTAEAAQLARIKFIDSLK